MNWVFLGACAALAAGLTASLLARASDDTPLKFRCIVKDAQILPDRLHVRCANRGMNGVSEFAAETSQPFANQVAAAVVQALRTGTTLVVTYAPSDELNPEGCGQKACRKIIEVGGSTTVMQPPKLQPLPASAVEPEAPPEEFSPVDATENEPSVLAAPVPTPAPVRAAPPPQPFKMKPVGN